MVQTTIPPIPPIPPFPQPAPPPDIFNGPGGPPEGVLMAAVLVVGMIVVGVILLPLIRAFARRLEGRAIDPALAAEVEHLRGRVAELEQSQHRLAELEERVDFSERLLTQVKDPQLLRAGGNDAPR